MVLLQMLNFLNPTVLFALTAGLIPLIIHLLNRRKIKQVEFSTIHFLKQMARKEMRRLRIRQILLLIIRTLIILLLVLVFARPTLRSGSGLLAGRTASEVVIILDNSLSLNSLELTGNLLEKIRQRWIDLEPAFRSGDRITVLLGVQPLKILADRQNYSPTLWSKITKQIQPGYLSGNLTDALFKAREIFQASELFNQELYILSDFQKNGVRETETEKLKNRWNDRVRIFCLPVFHGREENISVDSAAVVNRLVEKEQAIKIETTVRNQIAGKYLTSLVSLIFNDARVGQQNVSIAPGEQKPLTFQTTLNSSGFISGYVECEGDALLEDNRYYFNFFIPQNIRVLHLINRAESESYVPLILKPAVDKQIFSYRQKSLDEWQTLDFMKYQAIILEGVDQVPASLVSRLEHFTKSGRGLIIIPGNSLVPANINKLLKTLQCGQFLSRKGAPGQSAQTVTLGKINWDHSIFEGLFDRRKKINPVTFSAYYLLKPLPENETIMHLQNGDPFLTGAGGIKRNVFVLTAPLQPAWTDLSLRGLVVPLLYRIIFYSATRAVKERLNIPVGQRFAEVFRPLPQPFDFTLKRPSGDTEKIIPAFKGSDVLLQVEKNELPGNYRILQGKQLLTIYSVNHTPAESRQQFLGKGDMERLLPHNHWFGDEENILQQIETSRFGKELWPYLLGAVLLLLLLEMLLAYTGSRKQAIELQEQPAGS